MLGMSDVGVTSYKGGFIETFRNQLNKRTKYKKPYSYYKKKGIFG